jgi:hypothetical protein
MHARCEILGRAHPRQMHQHRSSVLCQRSDQHRARHLTGRAAILHASVAHHAPKGEDQSHGHSGLGWNVRASRRLEDALLTFSSAAIASICRLHALYILTHTTDITWDNPSTVIWSAIELNVGILCASLPTLRAFFIRIWPKAFLSSYNSRRANLDTGNGTKGQYYNMEGSIMVKKTVAVQSSRDLGVEDQITSESSSQPGRSESDRVTASSQEELATWSKH